MRDLDIGIVGAGLGGLAAAIAVARSGQPATLFEQTEVFGPVGAGISLWPNGVKVLAALGLGVEVARLGGHMDRMAYRTRDGVGLTDFALDRLYRTVGQRTWPVSRTDLQTLLVDTVGATHIRFGARCAGVEQVDGRPAVVLTDGSVHAFDLVVAADGTHSPLRRWVCEATPVERQYVGYVNFNAIVDHHPDYGPWGTWTTWVGEGKRASVMPVGGGRTYAFLDVPYEIDPGPRAGELEAAFDGWAPAVARLVDALCDGGCNRVAIHDVPPLPTWRRDRVVLLGDSAHGMAPDLGQGGCQALEDALVLAHVLATTDLSVDDALARYEAQRRPRTTEIVRRARKRAGVTHGLDPDVTEAWYAELADEDGTRVIDGLVESVVTGPCG